MSNSENNVNREHKDRLFKFIFGNPEKPEWTLSLYNAVSGKNYTNPGDIRLTTIENVLYMEMKNDISFLISDEMNFYEHQSTFNPNIPLRMYMYSAMVYSKYVKSNKETVNLYSSVQQKIPVPKCYCFYNGTTGKADRMILKLSDAFDIPEESDIELKVTMINVNKGHSPEIMEKCSPLMEYAWFVSGYRTFVREGKDHSEAVKTLVSQMPDEWELKEYLTAHLAEVLMMCITEYNEEERLHAEQVYVEGILRQKDESDRRAKESDRKAKESDRKAKESDRKARESERRAKESDKKAKESDKKAREYEMDSAENMSLLIGSVKVMMSSSNITAEQALDMIGVTGEKRTRLLSELQ